MLVCKSNWDAGPQWLVCFAALQHDPRLTIDEKPKMKGGLDMFFASRPGGVSNKGESNPEVVSLDIFALFNSGCICVVHVPPMLILRVNPKFQSSFMSLRVHLRRRSPFDTHPPPEIRGVGVVVKGTLKWLEHILLKFG